MGSQKKCAVETHSTEMRLTHQQILSVTCDNASVNDVMIEELAKLIPNYAGKECHVRCFLHILNLVAKTIIKLFDAPEKTNGETRNISDAEALLARLAEGIELEEIETRAMRNDEEIDNIEGYEDNVALLSDEEKAAFEEGILPVRLAIVKVSTTTSAENCHLPERSCASWHTRS
jgi:hypothetical protein